MRLFNKERNLMKKNQTPLYWAVRHRSEDIGELFISKGADINAIAKNSLIFFIIFFIKVFFNK